MSTRLSCAFVALIFIYARVMDSRDRKLEQDLEKHKGGDE